jgi:hypothetical protein
MWFMVIACWAYLATITGALATVKKDDQGSVTCSRGAIVTHGIGKTMGVAYYHCFANT